MVSENGQSAPSVYQQISDSGREEMGRPLSSLWWSGVAAGLGISLSHYVMGAIRVAMDGAPGALVVEKFGYCIGFLIVVLGRWQLFTENTITPVLPVLEDGSRKCWNCLWRIWSVVFVANLVGTFVAAAMPVLAPITTPEHNKALLDIARHAADKELVEAFFSGIPAGFLVASMVWMMPNSKGFEIFTIIAMTFAIAISNTSHVIVGSTELFTLLLHGEKSAADVALHTLLTGLGNIVGGTGLFAILAYAQVREEL